MNDMRSVSKKLIDDISRILVSEEVAAPEESLEEMTLMAKAKKGDWDIEHRRSTDKAGKAVSLITAKHAKTGAIKHLYHGPSDKVHASVSKVFESESAEEGEFDIEALISEINAPEQDVVEGTETKQAYHDRMHRLAASYAQITPERRAKMEKLPGWKTQHDQAMDYVKKNPKQASVKEDSDIFETFHIEYDVNVPVKESYTFSDFLLAAKELYDGDEAITVANEAFMKADGSIFAEMYSRKDVEERMKAHSAAGHKVSMPKYGKKDGQLHAEYVVQDKDTGVRRRMIYHGNVRKVENMGTPGKKDRE